GGGGLNPDESGPIEVRAFIGADIVGNTFANGNGTYSLTGLSADSSYRIEFIDLSGYYVPQWWNNKATMAEALAIPVSLGSNITGKDEGLVVAGTIKGEITGPDAALLRSGYNIYAIAYDSVSGDVVNSDRVNGSGEYKIPGLT